MDTSNKELVDAGFPVLLGALFAVVRMLLEKRRSVFSWLTGLFVGALTAYLTHLYLLDYQTLTEGQKAIIIGLTGLLSHDVLKGLLALGKLFREEPILFITLLRTGKWPSASETTKKNTGNITQALNKRNVEHKETQQDD